MCRKHHNQTAFHSSMTRQRPTSNSMDSQVAQKQNNMQTKPKLLNIVILASSIRVHSFLDVSMSPMGAVRGQRGLGTEYTNKISNKMRRL